MHVLITTQKASPKNILTLLPLLQQIKRTHHNYTDYMLVIKQFRCQMLVYGCQQLLTGLAAYGCIDTRPPNLPMPCGNVKPFMSVHHFVMGLYANKQWGTKVVSLLTTRAVRRVGNYLILKTGTRARLLVQVAQGSCSGEIAGLWVLATPCGTCLIWVHRCLTAQSVVVMWYYEAPHVCSTLKSGVLRYQPVRK